MTEIDTQEWVSVTGMSPWKLREKYRATNGESLSVKEGTQEIFVSRRQLAELALQLDKPFEVEHPDD